MMNKATVHPMRLALGGILALVMAVCARLVQPDLMGNRAPFRAGISPPSLIVPAPMVIDAIEGRVVELEGLVSRIQADTIHLRSALRQMRVAGGIVPAFASANPVSADDVRPGSGIEPKPAPVAAVMDPGHVSADLYAPAADLPRARSLFYGAQLGIFASRREALQEWESVANAPRLGSFAPHYLAADAGAVRLLVGPVPAEEASAICAEVRAEAPDCTVQPFTAANP